MGFPKGVSMRWKHHDTIDTEALAMNIALQLSMPHENPASMIHPRYMADLAYNNAMIKKHRKGIIQEMIDKIQIIAILASHCPHLKPTSVHMSDAMFNLMASGTAKRVLAKSGLDVGSKEAAKFLQSNFMLLLYVVRIMCSKEHDSLISLHYISTICIHVAHDRHMRPSVHVFAFNRAAYKLGFTRKHAELANSSAG